MSKYNQGYLGAQIGKLGNAVGRMWKGRPVMVLSSRRPPPLMWKPDSRSLS